MAKRKDPNQKGSGARKHGRNYRLRAQDFRTTGAVTRYRAAHGIPLGRRKDIHSRGECPVHNKAE
jgi:hypothetical protein